MVDVPMPEDSDLPSDVVAKLHSQPPISIYRLLAIVPGSVIPWADLVGAIYNCELPDRLREIGICRQARTARARYELFQHSQIARNVGVTQDELDTIHREPVVTSLDDYAAVARFTNATRAPIEADNPLATVANPNVW